MTLGQRIAFLRKQKKISQRALAKMLGLSQSAIAKYERDDSEPDILSLKKMSQIFNVTIDYLVSDDKDIVMLKREKFYKLLDCSKQLTDISKLLIELLKE